MDVQKARMKVFAEFEDYEIAGEYEDAGKSGKSIKFKLPIIEEDMELGLDNDIHMEIIVIKLLELINCY